MDQERVISNLRLQLRIERTVIAAAAIAAIVWWAWGRFADTKSMILVDGRPVVCVPCEADARQVLEEIKSGTGCKPSEIEFRQEVVVARAPRDANVVSRHKAMRVVQQHVSPVVPKWAIMVDGKPAAAVPSREIAGEVLDLAKLKYGRLATNLAEEPQFKENVTVDVAAVHPAIYRKTAQEALKLLFAEGPRVAQESVYVVGRGDIASKIAARCGVKLADLWAMNPGRNLNRLQIGDAIRIKQTAATRPRLTVIVRDLVQRTEPVPAPIQRVSSAKMYAGKTSEISPGRSGLREVRIAVIYENGHKTGSEILEERILREPLPRRVAVGIKPR